jgi:hypothetical protein
MGDNSKYFVEKKCREAYLKFSQQSTRAVSTLKQMAFGEKVKNKYATGTTLCTLSHHYHYQN